MTIHSQIVSMGVCALALWTGAATPVAADQITAAAMVPRLTIAASVGTSNQIQYCTNPSQPDWVVLTNLVLAETNYWFVDVDAPPAPGRFYRVAVALPTNNPAPTGMVLIPAGSFTMGDCMGDDSPWDLPLHTVYVSAFYMDRCEVTKALWDEVKAWNGGNAYNYQNAGMGKAANHPVVGVNWRDCVKWCNARSEKEGLAPCYYNEAAWTTVYRTGTNTPYAKWDANGYRLPTEAEWEKAARGGASGHRFPWTDTEHISFSRANYYSDTEYPATAAYDDNYGDGFDPTFANGNLYTSPVGYFAPNGYGLYDMAGNAWEWCWDGWTGYTSAPQTDPHGTPWQGDRLIRGGANDDIVIYCRVAKRGSAEMNHFGESMGFRSARSAGQ